MGELVSFRPQSEVARRDDPPKLTGFLPPLVVNPPRVKPTPLEMALMPALVIGLMAAALVKVWFGEGWRDR